MKTILILLLTLTSAACANTTTQLWKKKSSYTPFQENIHSIYINEESKEILFFGEKYHYILEADPLFQYTLQHAEAKSVQYSVNSATIYAKGSKSQVSFNIHLEPGNSNLLSKLHEVATGQLADWTGQPYSGRHTLYKRAIRDLENNMSDNDPLTTKTTQLKVNMNGKFYLTNDIVNQAVTPLQTPFQLEISKHEYTRTPLPLRVALTPVSVASDGVLTVGAIALGATAVTILAITQPDIKK